VKKRWLGLILTLGILLLLIGDELVALLGAGLAREDLIVPLFFAGLFVGALVWDEWQKTKGLSVELAKRFVRALARRMLFSSIFVGLVGLAAWLGFIPGLTIGIITPMILLAALASALASVIEQELKVRKWK